jgi:hypothetical protein
MKEVRRGRGQDFLYLGGDKEVRSADQLELSERNDPRLMLLMRRKGCQGGKRVPEPGQASRAGLLALATQVPFGWTCGLGWMAWRAVGRRRVSWLWIVYLGSVPSFGDNGRRLANIGGRRC